jgi:hypothetical protein
MVKETDYDLKRDISFIALRQLNWGGSAGPSMYQEYVMQTLRVFLLMEE